MPHCHPAAATAHALQHMRASLLDDIFCMDSDEVNLYYDPTMLRLQLVGVVLLYVCGQLSWLLLLPKTFIGMFDAF
jgi:hypothetical protein